MRRLNYHHLLYFWTVAREGTIAKACAVLHLTQPTVSGQLRALERAVGAKLFARHGRHLVLTDTGRVVYRYADEIFNLGTELERTISGEPAGRPRRVLVGVADTMPKEIAFRILEPVLRLAEPVQLVCEQGAREHLLGRLAVNALDVILADSPAGPSSKFRAFDHLLGECGVVFMAAPDLAKAHHKGFPRSLDGAPFLLPGAETTFRRSLEQWFEAEGIRPVVRGEFADPALLKVFGQHGTGVFAVRAAIEDETRRQYGVRLVGRTDAIRERFYAISAERKLKHPAVVAITAAARADLFGA